MKNTINCKRKSWKKIENSFIIGYAFVQDKLLTEMDIYLQVIDAIQKNNLNSYLNQLNGSYAAIICYNDKIYLIVDKLRSYPLIYSKTSDSYSISDLAIGLTCSEEKMQLLDISVAELLALGQSTGDKTLFKDTYNVNAGSYVILQNASREINVYYEYFYPKHSDKDEEVIEKSNVVMKRAFQRMLKTIGNRQIVIPLSGGYDSRLIACLCKEYELKNVVCFTYGNRSSWEIEISKQVAEKLGFEWHFIEYTEAFLLKVISSESYSKYEMFAGNYDTIPHIQDFPAIQFLIENKLIEPDAVVLPGHSGDLLGGSHMPDVAEETPVYKWIFKHYYYVNALQSKYRKMVLQELCKSVGEIPFCRNEDQNLDIFNNWNIKTRQSKFIVNSIRIYEFFDLNWRIPLWDCEFAEYWNSLDWEIRRNSTLFQKFLFEKYFFKYDVAFYVPTSGKIQRLFDKVRKIAPIWLIHTLRRGKDKIFAAHKKRTDLNAMLATMNYLRSVNTIPAKYISQTPETINGILAINYIRQICN